MTAVTDLSALFFFSLFFSNFLPDVSRAVLPRSGGRGPCTIISLCSLQKACCISSPRKTKFTFLQMVLEQRPGAK